MKFGKTYLAASAKFPPEWQQTAIEYRKLKKVINRVAQELTELGLTSEVLKDLLEQNIATTSNSTESKGGKVQELLGGDDQSPTVKGKVIDNGTSSTSSLKGKGKEQEESSADDGEEVEDEISAKARGKRAARIKRRPKATYELSGTSASPEPRIRLVFSSASSDSQTDSSGAEENALWRRQSSDTEYSTQSGSNHQLEDGEEGDVPRFTEVISSEDDSEKKSDEGNNEDSGFQSLDGLIDEREEFLGAGFKESHLLMKMYGVGIHSDEEEGGELRFSEDVQHDWSHRDGTTTPRGGEGRRASFETIRSNAATLEKKERKAESIKASKKLDDSNNDPGLEADDESPLDHSGSRRKRRHLHRQHRKEVFIPLNSDTEFLTLLAQALASIAALQVAQKKQFAQAVELLAREVSKVSSPSRPKTDLYVWREIFSLWVETQIFESSREKDRGERSAEEAEEKLDWFVDQVAKRKLAKKMRHKESRTALEQFIRLNVELLDMKRFQMANEEAARKILKKHDKRTALTASSGFPQFIAAASHLSSGTDQSETKKRGTLVLFGLTSLPHILLSTFTSTLLPIIPQLDDYECAICGEVAFKPIRLDCTHKFCVRCLVKMQKRGQDACPQCRAPVVLRANAANLDDGLQTFLKLWFPKEVKLKAHQNAIEAGKEEAQEMGMEDTKCSIQ